MKDRKDRVGYLGRLHPLAQVAAQHCDRHGVPVVGRIGRVACGACWERAIRDDEKVAVEHELPRELSPDPDYVDEVAVRQACRGERVRLTGAERRAAARELAAQGLTKAQIATRLRMSYKLVAEVLPAATVTVAANGLGLDGDRPAQGVPHGAGRVHRSPSRAGADLGKRFGRPAEVHRATGPAAARTGTGAG